MIALLPSAARTASGTLTVADPIARAIAAADRGVFQLAVTAAATDVGDTLDVFLQSSLDGTNWHDFVHFTQVLGNGGAKRFEAAWNAEITPTTALGPLTDGTLAAGVKQGPIGPALRVKWAIVDAGTVNASFTFKVDAQVYC